jgi:hypothetical protein
MPNPFDTLFPGCKRGIVPSSEKQALISLSIDYDTPSSKAPSSIFCSVFSCISVAGLFPTLYTALLNRIEILLEA